MLLTFTSEVGSDGGKFTKKLTPPLKFVDSNLEVGLVRSTICRAWPTVAESLRTNKVAYRPPNGSEYVITIPKGNYTLDLLNAYVQRVMKQNGHFTTETDPAGAVRDKYFIALSANVATGRVVITVTGEYTFNIAPVANGIEYNLCGMLGFTQASFTHTANAEAVFEGDLIPDFNGGITEVQIRTNLVSSDGAYSNGSKASVLYTFTPDKLPHAYMIKEPANPIYLPLNSSRIDSVDFYLVDQDGRELTTGGERTTITINIRDAK